MSGASSAEISPRIRVLLVEDNRIDQRLFERMVERKGLPYDYVIAASVEEAKEILSVRTFDVVILDYYVVGGTAEDLYPHVGRAAVIVATGGGDEAIAASALKAGAVDYLIKGSEDPFTRRLPLAIEKAITRRQEQDKLAMLSQAVMSISDSVYITDVDGDITFVNPAFSKSYGFEIEEVMGMQAEDLQGPLEQCSAAQGEVSLTLHRRKDGSTFPVESSASLILDENGKAIGKVVVVRDLTALERARKEKELLQIQLEQTERLRTIGQVASGIVHDFNNILGSILGFAELVMFDLPKKSVAEANQQQLLIAANRAKALVQQILQLGRTERTTVATANATAVVDEVLQLLRAMTPGAIEIVRSYSERALVVVCDKGKLGQVVLNLCTNALHAMGQGPGTLTVALEELCPVGNETARMRLSITDTGHGIPIEIQKRIFDPFFSTKKEGEGTGLGLSVVQEIITAVGGEIELESEVGKGTTWNVYLPSAVETVRDETPPTSSLMLPTEDKKRVLFVEDERPLAEVGSMMLQRLGYEVVMFGDGKEALEAFLENPQSFDVVVTDHAMPVMSGEALAAQIWAVRPQMPVVLVSGYRVGKIEGREGRFCVCLTKPVGLTQLDQALSKALAFSDSAAG